MNKNSIESQFRFFYIYSFAHDDLPKSQNHLRSPKINFERK